MVAIPVYVRHSISFRDGSSGKLDITIGPKQAMGKMVCLYRCLLFIILLSLVLYKMIHISCKVS